MLTEKRFIKHGALVLDRDERSVKVKGKEIVMTRAEFAVLDLLMRNTGMVVDRLAIIESAIWNNERFSNIADVHIKNIRKKLGGVDVIETVRGVGYRLKK